MSEERCRGSWGGQLERYPTGNGKPRDKPGARPRLRRCGAHVCLQALLFSEAARKLLKSDRQAPASPLLDLDSRGQGAELRRAGSLAGTTKRELQTLTEIQVPLDSREFASARAGRLLSRSGDRGAERPSGAHRGSDPLAELRDLTCELAGLTPLEHPLDDNGDHDHAGAGAKRAGQSAKQPARRGGRNQDRRADYSRPLPVPGEDTVHSTLHQIAPEAPRPREEHKALTSRPHRAQAEGAADELDRKTEGPQGQYECQRVHVAPLAAPRS